MNTNHDVQHDQVQTDFVFELMDFEIREITRFLQRGQIDDQLDNGTAALALIVNRPKLREDRTSHGSNHGSSIPVVLVEEAAEGAGAFDGSVLGSGIAVGFEERGDQSVETLALVTCGKESSNGVEYGSGFLVHRTVSLLAGTESPACVVADVGIATATSQLSHRRE